MAKNDRSLGRRSLLGGAVAVAGGAAVSSALPATAQAAPRAAAATAAETAATTDYVTVSPTDPRFPDLVRGTNQRWVAKPDYVRLVTTTAQAVRAVQDAVSANKRLTVRSGGHCYEDFVFNKDVQVVIDMSGMTQVYYDSAKNAFAVEGGASNIQIYETLYKLYGVTLPAGSCASVGAGGHISGGGYGLLSRLHGLTVDHLYGVEVVTVDKNGTAKAVVATRDSTDANLKDLWWAHTGGGGGNFGLITRYWLRSPGATGTDPTKLLPKPPSEVFVHATAFPWKDMTEASFTRLLQNWGAWHEKNSAPDSKYNSLFGLLKLNQKASDGAQIALLTQMDATVPDAQALLDEYLAAISAGVGVTRQAMTLRSGEHAAMPQFAKPRTLPWYIATDYLSGGNPTLYGKYKSAYARKGFSVTQIKAMYKHLTRTDYSNGDALVQIDSYGGRINAVKPGDTAVPQRDSVLKLQYQTYWTDPAEEAKHLAWIREFYKDVYAETGGVPVPGDINDGCYVNYPDKDLGDAAWNTSSTAWNSLYYKDNYARLQKAKAAWDPKDVFRHAQSVRLP
ncbi:FAD-binding oxidoreductase [Streptomyces spectabilis]|uniref:FAD-binding oxidoreductase n=1 Tax=Streptomyces spectabilis TaxID=68270 RepID=A0A516RCH7_STRST|nr:FAD-binding oxidoreductase [Streptomyces spectabilis]QDQ13352.1 FAD-binding oxidoreductase [Streptomyces spectabilis]